MAPILNTKNDVIVDFKDIKVMFRSKRNLVQAVRGVDFKVREGQIIGVVGESGSGKSVLVKSIIGFNQNAITTAKRMYLYDRQTAHDGKTGEVSLASAKHDLLKIKPRNWYKLRGRVVSYIPQNPLSSLNPTKKVGEQIYESFRVADKIHGTTSETKSIRERAVEILDYIGIHDPIKVLKSYPHELSGGMRQRVVIAISIAIKPHLIIADEPTTALDVSVQAKVIDIIKKINRELKIAIVFISHDISLIANFTQYVYVLYAGKIMERGKTSEVFGDPRHPYTWALLSAIPDRNVKGTIEPIPGTPPNLIDPPVGDVFAPRNKYALKIDFHKEPPLFQITDTHFAATWLLHPESPKVALDQILIDKLEFVRRSFVKADEVPTSTLKDAITNKLPAKSSFNGFNLKTLKVAEIPSPGGKLKTNTNEGKK